MALETATKFATDEKELKLDAPSPVPVVKPEKASGLVPVTDEQKSKLDEKVDDYIDDLVAQDVNSPEFGKRVDQLTNMGRKEIADAAGQSNRFLDRPVRAMDADNSVGSDLAELRRTVEDLDPSKKGNLLAPRKIFGIIPFGSKLRGYFDGYKSAQMHISTILERLTGGKDELLMDNAAIDVRAAEPVERHGAARANDTCVEDTRYAAGEQGRRSRRDRPRQGKGDPRNGAILCSPAHTGFAHANGRDGAGVSRARSGQKE